MTNLEERVAELEQRISRLEAADRGDADPAAAPTDPSQDDFWALTTWKQQLDAAGIEGGGVLYTGAVRLPSGERYEWQLGLDAEGLLAGDLGSAAETLAALGHPVRLLLLREVLLGRNTVSALAEVADLGTSGQVYHHLRQLTGAGWLHTVVRGRYAVPPGRVVPLLVALAVSRR
jgi:DNA-binding transcriptional ArsR family regulator